MIAKPESRRVILAVSNNKTTAFEITAAGGTIIVICHLSIVIKKEPFSFPQQKRCIINRRPFAVDRRNILIAKPESRRVILAVSNNKSTAFEITAAGGTIIVICHLSIVI